MDKYSKMMSAYVKIWFTASVINALISSLIILQSVGEQVIALFFLVLLFSIILSIPIIAVAMLSTAIALSLQKDEHIFGTVLVVVLFSSIAGALFFKGMLGITSDDPLPLGLSIVVSALAATIIVFRHKLTEQTSNEE